MIDELGRGTSTKEGLAIALAISEKLIEKGCRVFFATHFTELGESNGPRPQSRELTLYGPAKVLNSTKQNSVLSVHLTGESIRNGETTLISLPHSVASGPVKSEDYGLDLARRFLPERVVNNAERISKFLRDRQASKPAGPTTRSLKQNKLLLALPGLLKQAHSSTMDDSALASYLKKLQTEFTIRMNTAADDDADARDGNENAELEIEHPVLEKPDEGELQEWKKKCDAAERRVMHANMAQTQERKRPATMDNDRRELRKRNKTDDIAEGLSTPTPINRSSIIEELERERCSLKNMEETPSRFTTDILDPVTEGDLDLVDVVTPTSRTCIRNLPGQRQRAVSISSDGLNGEDATEDSAVGHGRRASASEASDIQGGTIQPLQRFEPLRDWFSRDSREANTGVDESGHSMKSTTSPLSQPGAQELSNHLEDERVERSK